MIKLFIGILFFLSSLSAFAEPYVSPDDCLTLAQDLYTIASAREAGVKQDMLLSQVPDNPAASKFYTYWIKVIYSSKADGESIAVAFYTACMAAQGDLAKVEGEEA